MTILVGIDVAKDKHDCFIMNSEGEVLAKSFTILNNKEGFDFLYKKIQSVSSSDKIKVGLEATGHYSYNIIGFLLNKDLATFILNPLHTNLYRKSLSLRKTKTDKIDSKTIAMMLLSDVSLKSYSDISYHNEDLKSLTRYRFSKVEERAKLKTSLSRLAQILFPELEKLVPTLHMTSIYQLLEEFPSASAIASAHLTRLTKLLSKASKGHYNRDREAAKNSIGSNMPAKSLELKHTIKLIRALTIDIGEIEAEISKMMDKIASPITTIPGIGNNMGAMIISEIGDFSRFSSPDKILAYAGYSPSTYQSGKLDNCYAHMEKRGSHYLRYALFQAKQRVCHLDSTFSAYLAKKRAEGKHYYVAISHAVKKLVRVIFHLEKTKQAFLKAS
ncbi:IS110 family transposase [Phascolarctobacterium succinatutens]|uniref:IS110 family transposase n=1 Tax=Phascolarctobacterium succinatutens TaxID=626940 RepID=UPI003AF11712